MKNVPFMLPLVSLISAFAFSACGGSIGAGDQTTDATDWRGPKCSVTWSVGRTTGNGYLNIFVDIDWDALAQSGELIAARSDSAKGVLEVTARILDLSGQEHIRSGPLPYVVEEGHVRPRFANKVVLAEDGEFVETFGDAPKATCSLRV